MKQPLLFSIIALLLAAGVLARFVFWARNEFCVFMDLAGGTPEVSGSQLRNPG
jgi:hypothetical protein